MNTKEEEIKNLTSFEKSNQTKSISHGTYGTPNSKITHNRLAAGQLPPSSGGRCSKGSKG